MIEKRHLYLSDDILRSSPSIMAYNCPSLTLRQELADVGVSQLGAEAALNAINDWGGQASDITHLVATRQHVVQWLHAWRGLQTRKAPHPQAKRFMLYQTGCHGACYALRLSKDLAVNNAGAQILMVCSEVCTLSLRGLSESHIGDLVGQAILGDAAGAVVVGSCPSAGERAVFELLSASLETVPGTEVALVSKLLEEGIVYSLRRDIPLHVSSPVERLVQRVLLETMAATTPDMNVEMFWVVHPGGRGILDMVQSRLGLWEKKLAASRAVTRQYGNTRSSSVLLEMEGMRQRSEEKGLGTSGEDLEWGLVVGYGPGIILETILLRALPNKAIR